MARPSIYGPAVLAVNGALLIALGLYFSWCNAGLPRCKVRGRNMILGLVLAGFMAAAPSALETARDHQDRAALEKMVNEVLRCRGQGPQ